MIELQARHIVDAYDAYTAEPWEEQSQVYLKVEADAVIAELEQKLEDAKATAYAESVDAGMRELGLKRELCRQKYKRCLDKANYWLVISYHCIDDKHKQRAERRHYKWLELAKKLKEAK